MSSSSALLTDALLRRLVPRPDRQFEVFDRRITGLGVRVSPGGSRSFVLLYRIAGRSSRLTLGRYPTISLAEARQKAQAALNQVARGLDPAAEKVRVRDGYATSLFPAVVDDFIEHHARRKTKRWRERDRSASDGAAL